jgi:hypothetical protein
MEFGESSMCGYTGIIARVIMRHTAGQDEHGAGGRADLKGKGSMKLSLCVAVSCTEQTCRNKKC